MPFLVTCQCGKKLRVADENRGKKVRCPACQSVVLAEPEAAPELAAAPTPPPEEVEAKRRPEPAEEDVTPRKRPRREEDEEEEEKTARKTRPDAEDEEEERPRRRSKPTREDEEDEDRPARKPSRKADEDEEDEAPAKAKRKRVARDDADDEDDDRPAKKKPKKSGSKAWLWVGCGCGSLLFLSCAGIIVVAIVFGKSADAQVIGNWEIDRDAAAQVNPQFLAAHKQFGYRFNLGGEYEVEEDGRTSSGHWKAEKKDDNTILLRLTHGDAPAEFTEEVTLKDDEHIQIRREKGEVVPLKRNLTGVFSSIDPKTLLKKPGNAGRGEGEEGGKSLAFMNEHTKDVSSLAFRGNDLLASASWDGTFKVWEPPTTKSKYTLKGHTGQARSVAFVNNGRALACGSGDPAAKTGEVRVWDLANGTEFSVLYKGEHAVEAVASHSTGRLLAWSEFADVVLWEVNGNRQLTKVPAHSWDVEALAMADSGRTLAVAGGQEVKLWTVPTAPAKPGKPGKAVTPPTAADFTLKTQHFIKSVALSLDGKLVAAGGQQGNVTLWEVSTGAQKWTGQSKEKGDVKGLAFSRDGRVLVAACGTVQFWDAAGGADLGQWRSDKEGHSPYAAAFSADGKKLATGALNGTIKVWDAATLPGKK